MEGIAVTSALRNQTTHAITGAGVVRESVAHA